MFWFGRKKETQEEKECRIKKANEEIQLMLENAEKEYHKLCNDVKTILEKANKPAVCNTIRFADEPYIFPKLESYQCLFDDWEIWKNDNILYIYKNEVCDYPESYGEADAPAMAKILISDIQYFRIEGEIYTESKISGGKITQNRYTGRIRQTAIQSKTIQHDNRIVKMSVVVNGIVKLINFKYSAYDVLCALIPDKEHK